MVKSPAEIALIQKATDASIASQLAGMRAIKPGVRERTIAGIDASGKLIDFAVPHTAEEVEAAMQAR